mgnify:CR=1 FL=1
MIEEKHPYDTDRLMARLKRYARHWIKNQKKYDDQNQSDSNQTSGIPIR